MFVSYDIEVVMWSQKQKESDLLNSIKVFHSKVWFGSNKIYCHQRSVYKETHSVNCNSISTSIRIQVDGKDPSCVPSEVNFTLHIDDFEPHACLENHVFKFV